MMILLAIVVGYIAFSLMELILAVIEKLTDHLEKMGTGIRNDAGERINIRKRKVIGAGSPID